MVSHIFLLLLCKLFSAKPKGLKSFTIIGQHFFNPIYAVPREIHKPPGNKEGMPREASPKKKKIVPCRSACCQLGFIWIDKPKDFMPNSKAYEAPFRA